jgi:pyruvate,orthophosphate dikinase
MLKSDFKEVFKIMDGLPVIVRLIDSPLHEFLPKPEEVLEQIYQRKMRGEGVSSLEKLYRCRKQTRCSAAEA